MNHPIILFVCEHGAAKSILAAAFFNKLARERGLHFKAIARGTQPDAELSLATLAGLRDDGLIPTETIPAKLISEDIESAHNIISFCDLPGEYHQKAVVERWHEIPPVSEGYAISRDAIVERIQSLLDKLST